MTLFSCSSIKMDGLSKLVAPLEPTPVFASYWYFAAERQRILMQRLKQADPPWTSDPILQTFRFTNAYRMADRVSQYLIHRVLYDQTWNGDDLFFRCILFKIFNKIETWELLKRHLGEPESGAFSTEEYGAILSHAMLRGIRIYSAAYIMPSGGSSTVGMPKHMFHLRLLKQMMDDGLPGKISRATSLSEVFKMLGAYPSIGPFLAFQYSIDLNYSTLIDFPENSFVVAGPGAQSGISKCFRNFKAFRYEEIIHQVTNVQNRAFNVLNLDFQRIANRPLQPIDCQNLFCEIDKYSRVAHPEFSGKGGRSRIKMSYSPGLSSSALRVALPSKWEK